MEIASEEEFTTEVRQPLRSHDPRIPLVGDDRAQWLIDLDERPTAPPPNAKIRIPTDHFAADEAEDFLEDSVVFSLRGGLAQGVKSAPTTLDGLIEFNGRVAPPKKRFVFANGRNDFAVLLVAGI